MATLYVMEAANIFAGDHDPSASNHIAIQTLKLPGLENNYVDHAPGGSPMAIEIDTHLNRLEATFNLAGWTPHVAVLLRQWDQKMRTFTARGVIRDRRTGEALQGMAIMEGSLGRVNPTDFRRGDLFAHEYSIRGITSYELTIAGNQLFKFSFFDGQYIIGGRDTNGAELAMLGLNSGGTAGAGLVGPAGGTAAT